MLFQILFANDIKILYIYFVTVVSNPLFINYHRHSNPLCHCHFKSSVFVNAISNPLYSSLSFISSLSMPFQILFICTAISNPLCQCHFKSSLFVIAISNPLCQCHFKSALFVTIIQILFVCLCHLKSSLSMSFQILFIRHCHFKSSLMSLPFQISSLFVNAISNPLCH